jgi:hypothetical protein
MSDSFLFPEKIDQIVTKNRDKLDVYLTTDNEMAELFAEINDPSINVLFSCRIVTFFDKVNNSKSYSALGIKDGISWITSKIKRYDVEKQLIETNSGKIYKIELNQTEPGITLLLHVAYAIRNWFGKIDFGVVEVFY